MPNSPINPMEPLLRWCRSGWKTSTEQIQEDRKVIRAECLRLLGHRSVEEFLTRESSRFVVVLLNSGNGTRWQTSLQQNPERGRRLKVVAPGTPEEHDSPYGITAFGPAPRGSLLVPNLLPGGGPPQLPILAYSYDAFTPLTTNGARHVTTIGNPVHAQMFETIAKTVGSETECVVIPPDGGQARTLIRVARDCMDSARDGKSPTILTHFGGDPLSQATVTDLALFYTALERHGFDVSSVHPLTAYSRDTVRALFDIHDRPMGFEHARHGDAIVPNRKLGNRLCATTSTHAYSAEWLTAVGNHPNFQTSGLSADQASLEQLDLVAIENDSFFAFPVGHSFEADYDFKKLDDLDDFCEAQAELAGHRVIEPLTTRPRYSVTSLVDGFAQRPSSLSTVGL